MRLRAWMTTLTTASAAAPVGERRSLELGDGVLGVAIGRDFQRKPGATADAHVDVVDVARSRLVAGEAGCGGGRGVGPVEQGDVVTAALGEHEPGSVLVDDVREVAQPASAGSGRHVEVGAGDGCWGG